MKFQKLHLNMLVDRVIIGPTNPDNPEYRVYPAEVIRTVIKIIVRSVPGYQRVNGSPWCQKNCERRSIRVSTSCLCAKRFKKPVALPTGDDPMGMRGRTNERGSGVAWLDGSRSYPRWKLGHPSGEE